MKKKELFKIFTAGLYESDTLGKSIAVQSAPFVFRGVSRIDSWSSGHVFFKLVDLTGNGILDVWVESYNGVAVISFQTQRGAAEGCSQAEFHSGFKTALIFASILRPTDRVNGN